MNGECRPITSLSLAISHFRATRLLIDNSSGGTIDGNTAINVDAANITANSLLAQINNTSGTIGGNANINFNLTGDLQTVGDASFSILNGGGTIGADAAINVNAASISIGGSLSSTTDVTADTASGGTIGVDGAKVTFQCSAADLTTQGDATFQITNFDNGDGLGTIGADAAINVSCDQHFDRRRS